jgi:uroporphyrin-III C-methyltransferase
MNKGKVFIIGAGPGDLDLLTLRAVRMIKQADVLMLDDLVNPAIVTLAKPTAQVMHVGKRAGLKSITQEAIHQEMTRLAQAGLCVARIKGGDPFVFGRGGEELARLLEDGVEVSTVNGISAGLAAPAMLGIPLSHREHAHSVTFITGHDGDNDHINWRALALSGGTLVVFMGIRRVDSIVANLLKNGMSRSTPAAVIERATLPDERGTICRLSELPEIIKQENYSSPAILVIGKVVELSPRFEQSQAKMLQSVETA